MKTNTPFRGNQVAKLKIGFTPSGNNPNRKQRREILQKKTHNPHWGFQVHHYQWVENKVGGMKQIPHLSLHASKGNWR
jgi:hypothetical protein